MKSEHFEKVDEKILEKVPASVRESFRKIQPEWWNSAYTNALGFIGTSLAQKGDFSGVYECADSFPQEAELLKMKFLCRAAEAASKGGFKVNAKNIFEDAAATLEHGYFDRLELKSDEWLNAFVSACIELGEANRARVAIEKYLNRIKNESQRISCGYDLMPSFKKLAAFYVHEGNMEKALALTDICPKSNWQSFLLLTIARTLQDEKQAQKIIADVEGRAISSNDYVGYKDKLRAEIVKTEAARGKLTKTTVAMKEFEGYIEASVKIELARFVFAKNGKEAAETIIRGISLDDPSLSDYGKIRLLKELAGAEMEFGNHEAAKTFLEKGIEIANARFSETRGYLPEAGENRRNDIEDICEIMADLGEVDGLKKLGEAESDRQVHDFIFAQAVRAELSRS